MAAHALLHDVSRPGAWPAPASGALELLLVPAPGQDRLELAGRLAALGVRLVSAPDLVQATRLATNHPFEWALVDLADETHALASIRLLRASQQKLRLAALVDETGAVTAGQARLAGVTDLLPWPVTDTDLALFVANLRERVAAGGVACAASPHTVFACSTTMQEAMRLARLGAGERAPILVVGEPGSGRRLMARTVHDLGPLRSGPFVVVDCADGAPEGMEAAAGGTLCLAHISSLSRAGQARLTRLDPIRFRLIATDAGPIERDRPIEPGLETLLAGGRIDVPPLRRRRADIPLLAAHLLDQCRTAAGHDPAGISRSALTLIAALPWPGNGAELRELMARLARAPRRVVIQVEDVLEHVTVAGLAAPVPVRANATLRDAKVAFERECISGVIVQHGGRMSEAAKALGIQRTNLYRKVRQLKIERSLFAPRK